MAPIWAPPQLSYRRYDQRGTVSVSRRCGYFFIRLLPRRGTHEAKDPTVIETQPHLETVVENYDVMLDEMRDLIARELPSGSWSSARNATIVDADEFPGLSIGRSALWIFTASSTPTHRMFVVDELAMIGARYGFGSLEVDYDFTGGFQSTAFDEFGARLDFGGSVHLTISYTTGIHAARTSRARLVA